MDWDEQEGRRRRAPSEADRRRSRENEAGRRRENPDRPRQPTGDRRPQPETRSSRPRQQNAPRRRSEAQPQSREKKPRETARAPSQTSRQAPAAEEEARRIRQARRRQAEQRKRAEEKKRRAENRRTPPKALPRRKLLWKLLTTAAVAAALVLGLTIFFKVQNVNVTGNEKYTAETIFAASGIEKGENLLTFGKSRAAGRILAELPYVSQVQIGIKLPNTVNIDIVELEVSYAVRASDGAWWLMDYSGKLLEPVDEAEAAKHTQVLGVRASGPVEGAIFTPGDADDSQQASSGQTEQDAAEQTDGVTDSPADRAQAALEILKALEETDHMGDVTTVDVSSLYDIQLWYGQQYQILLGGPAELSYKIRYMTQAVASLPDYQSGVLDLTFQEDRKAVFTPW